MQHSRPPLSGRAQLYGLFADPVEHLQAPAALNALFDRRGVDAVCVPLPRYDNARCPIVCTRLRSAAGLRVCQSVVNRHLMPAPVPQLPAVCTSLRCGGPELAAGVVRATGGRPARRPPEQPALACGGG
jgi:hypothetical protein